MTWTSVRVVAGGRREEALAALFDAGAQGIHEDGSALVTHFPADVDVPTVVAAIKRVAPDAQVEIGRTDTTDWSVAWRDRIGAQELGPVVIAPPWLADNYPAEQCVVIEPGMAFGTGDHPTTRGVVRLMSRYVSPGFVVADLGAGSAVLSLVAAKLGASRAFAIEYDADAIGNAELNVQRNGADAIVHVFEGDAAVFLPLVAPVDLVVANIISSALVDLLPAIERALQVGGVAILSGILLDERDAMLEIFASDGWRVVDEDMEDAWWSVVITKA